MKNNIIVFAAASLISQFAVAACGVLPSQPALLEEARINVKQLEALEPQLETYLQSIDSYQACVDNEVTSIDPDSADYQIVYEEKTRLWDAAEEQKMLAINRYDKHIKTVDTQLPEEAGTDSQ